MPATEAGARTVSSLSSRPGPQTCAWRNHHGGAEAAQLGRRMLRGARRGEDGLV